jgi:arsenite-transporting ATPase
VFRAFARTVQSGVDGYVIIDTAPTGHTLLLLDATGSYHRDVLRQAGGTGSFSTPMMRLQDPDHTAVLIVTLPETTPVLEAQELVTDLRRAGISPWAWVVNDCLSATGTTDPLLVRRARNERAEIDAVLGQAPRCAVLPLLAREPVGLAALRDLVGEGADVPVGG